MSIPAPIRTNFQTLLRAAQNGDLALLECTDAENGQVRYVVCAIARDGETFLITPFGHMISDRDPYSAYIPPARGTDEIEQ